MNHKPQVCKWVPLVDVDGGNTQVASALKFCQCEEVRDKLLFSFSCFKLDDNDNYNSPKDRRNMKKTNVLSIAVYIYIPGPSFEQK